MLEDSKQIGSADKGNQSVTIHPFWVAISESLDPVLGINFIKNN